MTGVVVSHGRPVASPRGLRKGTPVSEHPEGHRSRTKATGRPQGSDLSQDNPKNACACARRHPGWHVNTTLGARRPRSDGAAGAGRTRSEAWWTSYGVVARSPHC